MRSLNLLLKRCIDFWGSLIGIIILSPLLLIIAIAIKVTAPGPVFFKQKRLGINGSEFEILKFRTMIVNAEKIGDGLTVKSDNDNRITKIGKFLRATSLDELPQLINVLKGEMSLVGPRPPVTYFPYNTFNSYPEWAKKRFDMRPGVTGLAQVTVRNSVPWDGRIEYDNEYVEKFNVLLDFKIILLTFKRVFKSEDIYGQKNN